MVCLSAVDSVSALAAVTARTGDNDKSPVRFTSGAAVTSSTGHAARSTRGTAVATDTTVTASPQTRCTICWTTGAAVTAEPACPGNTVKTAGRTTITASPTVSSDTDGQQRAHQEWECELPAAAQTAGPAVAAGSSDAVGAGYRATGTAVATVATDPDRPIATHATGTTVAAGLTSGPITAVTTATAATDEVPPGASRATVGAGAAVTTGATIAKQPSRATLTACHPGLVATPAGAAITEEPAAATPGRVDRRPDVAVADQTAVVVKGKQWVDQVVQLCAE